MEVVEGVVDAVDGSDIGFDVEVVDCEFDDLRNGQYVVGLREGAFGRGTSAGSSSKIMVVVDD